ncbi:MAG TPA: metalloregulator ArsR/SmtB family transcription factor, partial [Dongiaceae bacterium]|nr:metalloregulator ArsR/SmtB family transcription factor [Dongiaceae bacterium]
ISAPSLDLTFAALADPTRRAILLRLAEGERTVNELAAPFEISLPAISRHLKLLEQAALITRIRDGQHRRCRLKPSALETAADWLAFHNRFWSESFDRLDAELRRTRKTQEKPHGSDGKARSKK